MIKTYGRVQCIMASLFALSIASASCGMSPEQGAEGIDLSGVGARAQAIGDVCPTGIETTIIEVAPNQYYISYRTTLAASHGAVWARVQNFEELVQIAFDGATSDFEWVDGAPGQTPSLVAFNYGDQRLVEEIEYRNSSEKILRYGVAETPVLGIEEYHAEIDVDQCGTAETLFVFTRQVTFSSDVDANAFFDLFMAEIVNIKTFFENNPNG
jgi:hypothetical protein